VIVLGIDPGISSGGLAFVGDDEVETMPMPDLHLFCEILLDRRPHHVFLEKGQTHPRDGRVGAFNYGHHCGGLEAVLVALNCAYTLVSPPTWMKAMHAGTNGKDTTKERSVAAARRLFPHADLHAGPRSKKPHLGVVEALLLAEFGRRQLRR
jgi:hypothetical protein